MPNRSTSDWILEALSFAALAAIIGTIAAHWTELPAQVPTHFGASGAPNGWGGKNAMLLLPSASVGLYILMTIASRYQRLINLPMKIDRNVPEVQRLLQSMSITLKTVLLFVFAYLEWAQVNTALARSSGLGTLFLPLLLIAAFLPLSVYLKKLRKYQRL